VSTPKDKKVPSTGGAPLQKQKRKKEKLIRLDDLIPKGNVAGGRRLLFGASDSKPTTNQTKER
jgi:hypothetical protein